MAFRFRKSVKLAPGLRLNISKTGCSVSVGGRGATVNLSKRGAYSTFGVPGTGMSWRSRIRGASREKARRPEPVSPGKFEPVHTLEQFDNAIADPRSDLVYANSGRRLSPQQVEAQRRRMIEARQREAANAEVRLWEEQHRNIVECWRNMIYLTPAEVYSNACKTLPFKYSESPPNRPSEKTERNKLAGEIRRVHLKKRPIPVLFLVCIPAAAMVVGLIALALLQSSLGAYAWLLVVLSFAASCAGGYWGVRKWWTLEFEKQVQHEADEQWPNRAALLQQRHEAELAAYQQRKQEATRAWQESERDRTAWARLLVGGDLQAIELTVCDSLTDLDFPFETQCSVGVSEADRVFLNLDLPEIEDVISEQSYRVLKDGTIRQTTRNKGQRFGEYATLVAGLTILMAATAFAAAPTVKVVSIAAYTQRNKRGNLVDDYVLHMSVTRQQFESMDDPQTVQPIEFILMCGASFRQKKSLELSSLEPPEWISAFAVSPDQPDPSPVPGFLE